MLTLRLAVAAALLLLCSACSPSLTVTADDANGATLAFQASFSAATEKTLRALASSISGSSSEGSIPVIAAQDVDAVLRESGFTDISAKNASATSISASARYPVLTEGALAHTGILTRTAQSLTLTVGAQQIYALYALCSEESRLYFDLLMLPAIEGGQLTVKEYNEQLAALYGKSFADEITGGTLTITLVAPSGKKRTTAKVTLGELLTLTAAKSWTVAW